MTSSATYRTESSFEEIISTVQVVRFMEPSKKRAVPVGRVYDSGRTDVSTRAEELLYGLLFPEHGAERLRYTPTQSVGARPE